jgi:hypothetical protein
MSLESSHAAIRRATKVLLLSLTVGVGCSFAALSGGTVASPPTYYVSPVGDDDAKGTLDHPFRTIQHAADVMVAGDTCLIREGTYRETVRPAASGEAGRPITFRAYPGEIATVSGADVLEAEWTVHEGSIYKAATSLEFVQLFVNGRMMNEARWPNAEVDRLLWMGRAKTDDGTDYGVLVDAQLPEGDWNGGLVHIWPGGGWLSWTRRITEYTPRNRLVFDRPLSPTEGDHFHMSDPYRPQRGSHYCLLGSLAGLDIPTEWHLDAEAGEVYLWTPDGASPAEHQVQVKQRRLAFDLTKRSHVHVEGLHVFAAAIKMQKSHHCVVDGVRARYTEHFHEVNGMETSWAEAENLMDGSHNEWRNSLIAYSAGHGLYVEGTDNKVTNCIIHDVNYGGGLMAAVTSPRNSTRTIISRNTMYNCGRGLIAHYGATAIRIEYNDLSAYGLLSSDLGAAKSWGTDGAGSVIAYNWVHDSGCDQAVGIYLDNFCRNYTVHHNVVWNVPDTAIGLNSDSINNYVYNNTLLGAKSSFAIHAYAGYAPDERGTHIINNIADSTIMTVTGANAPVAHHNGNYAIGEDFVPTPDSGAVDAGVVIPGINDDYVGSAPDIGAYERGGVYWKPGADWTEEP